MVRTDLVFERNRDRLRFYQRRGARNRCLFVFLTILVGLGVVGYVFRGQFLAVWQRVAPVVQSQGRAVMGKMSLLPLTVVIEVSALPAAEKGAWKDFTDKAWALAEESGDVVYRREDVIDLARRVVESAAGLYHALMEIEARGTDGIGLDEAAQTAVREAIRKLNEDVARGKLGAEQLAPLKGAILSALLDIRLGTVTETERAVAAGQRRLLLQSLKRLSDSPERLGHGVPKDMTRELRAALEEFRREVERRKMAGFEAVHGGRL